MASYEGKKDFTIEIENAIAESNSILSSGSLDAALAPLLPLERKVRLQNDYDNLQKLCSHMVNLCITKRDWEKLISILTLLQKRCGQIRQVLTAIVKDTMKLFGFFYDEKTEGEMELENQSEKDEKNELDYDKVEEHERDFMKEMDLETKISLIKNLIQLCEGQLFLESEFATLCFFLSYIYEVRQKNTIKACEAVQDIHVETYGSLSRKQKIVYILEQIRLNLKLKDFIRVSIHSKKIMIKNFKEEPFFYLKLKFYTMQIEYFTSQKDTLEVANAYYQIACTPTSEFFTSEDRGRAIESYILFLFASEGTGTQKESVAQLKKDILTYINFKRSDKLLNGASKDAVEETFSLKHFLSRDVVNNKFKDNKPSKPAVKEADKDKEKSKANALTALTTDKKDLSLKDTFSQYFHLSDLNASIIELIHLFTTSEIIKTPILKNPYIENHYCFSRFLVNNFTIEETVKYFLSQLQLRIVQYNIYIVSLYYDRVSFSRFSSLIDLNEETLEDYLGDILQSHKLHLRIDRPKRIVDFQPINQGPDIILNKWSEDINKMLELMESTSHLISRENMVHKLF